MYESIKSVLEDIQSLQLLLDFDYRWIQHQRRNSLSIKPALYGLKQHIEELIEGKRLELERFRLEIRLEILRLERLRLEGLGFERIARLWRSLEYLALLLLSTLRFLLGCRKFGAFQNRQRPRCTTMPWTIWPSLVVLWGVCWMFVNTPLIEFDATRFNSLFVDEELSLSVPNLSLGPSFTPIPADFDQFLGNVEFANSLDDAAYAHAPYLDRQTLNDISLGSIQQNYQDQTSPREVVDFPTYSTSPPGDSSSHPDNEINETATTDFPIRQLHMNVSQVANTHVNSHPLASQPATATIFSRPSSEAPLVQQTSTVSKQQQIPPRNADGKLICTDHGCSDKTFRRYCDWQIHVNKHQRPFRCSNEGCPRSTSGFATKGVLDRHVIRVHQSSRSASSGPTSSIGAEVTRGVSATMTEGFVASDHEKRKRLPSGGFNHRETNEADGQDAIAENTPKRVKVVIQGPDEVACTTPNIEELVTENEILQQQLDKASEDLDRCKKEREKEREMMLGIIDRLITRAK